MYVLDKTVRSLVDENFIYARALHYLGIAFYKEEHLTLKEVCAKYRIDYSNLVKSLYRLDGKSRIPMAELKQYPLGFTLEYLRYSHHTYIKEQLPYIAKLVAKLDNENQAIEDLMHSFPLFVEDFIKHIYSEEDEVFSYIQQLLLIKSGREKKIVPALWPYRNLSLQAIYDEHKDEDEMQGMRQLSENLHGKQLLLDVVIKELKAFDRELLYHAEIENNILFKRAIKIESEVLGIIQAKSRLN